MSFLTQESFLTAGGARLRDRLECPVILAVAAVGDGISGGARCARVGRAHAHPGHEIVHLRRRELSVGRHLQVGVGVADRLDQQALLRIAGDDGRAADAALFPAAAPVERQSDDSGCRLAALWHL